MKKKIAIAIAVVLCLAFALSGCGMVNKKFTPETQTRKITQAVDMAAGLENVTGGKMKKQDVRYDATGQFYVVEGTQKNGGKRETRVYSYSSGEMILSLVDTAVNKFYVRELDSVGYTIYVEAEPTDEELEKYREDNTYKLTHYGAIYSCNGKLIVSREEKSTDRYIGEVTAGKLATVFPERSSKGRLFLRTYDDKLWEMNDKNDYDLIATGVPFYNTPVDYDYKAGGYYYVLDSRSITCYDSAFNRISVYNAPSYSNGDSFIYPLNNGKALVQTHTFVSDSSKDYSYTDSTGSSLIKVKINTLLVDPIKGTEKKIKCDYLLSKVYTRSNALKELYNTSTPVMFAGDFNAYADNIENIAIGFKVKDKTLDMSNGEVFVIDNNGKAGDSLKLVSNQDKYVLDTVDGKYFLLTDDNNYIHVFNNKLKEVKSYPASVLTDLTIAGPYLIDDEEQVIYDYALNEVYRSPKNADGDFEEGIIAKSVGTYDYRIVIMSYAGETADGAMMATLNEFRDGQKKQLCTFSEEGDNMLVFEEGSGELRYDGYDEGGQFYCLTNSEGSEYRYYNFDGKLIYKSAAKLGGYSIEGGPCIMVNAASNIYMLFK